MDIPDEHFAGLLVRRGIVLQGALAEWVRASPGATLTALLAARAPSIAEADWMEAMAGEPGYPPVLPSGDPAAIPRDLLRGEWAPLLRLGGAVLRDMPRVMVAMVNPLLGPAVRAEVERLRPGRAMDPVLVTPHFWADLLAWAQGSGDGCAADPGGEDLAEWAGLLGLPEAGLLTVLSALSGDGGRPVPPGGFFTHAGPVPGAPGLALLARSATVAWIAAPDPSDESARDRAMSALGLRPVMWAACPSGIRWLLGDAGAEEEGPVEEMPRVETWSAPADASPEKLGLDLWNQVVAAASERGASDVHLDPKEERVRVRFRIHGDLIEQPPLPLGAYDALLRRCKIQGNMRQSVKGVFQDGSGEFRSRSGRVYEQRYAIAVAKGGAESLVIRMLDREIPRLDRLHMSPESRRAMDWFLAGEGGMMVISGPTGSGKTTTLYACLGALATPERKIITVEQPVEKMLADAVQIEVREDGEVSFAKALRAVVRADPDVLMVGEVRDPESAGVAIQAALTGHLLLTTVHANDAAGVIERLCQSFGCDPVAVGYALKLVLAQRLVPLLCDLCKNEEPARAEELRWFPPVDDVARPVSARAGGCPACRGLGVSGRLAIAEVLVVDEAMRGLLEGRASPTVLRQKNRERGFPSLGEQAARLALTGRIAMAEARRFFHAFAG